MSETEATQKSWEGADRPREDPEMQNKSQQQTKTIGRGLTLGFLIALAVVSLAVGIGAGIGAGYGIFHKDSTDTVMSDPMSTEEQWLVVMNADNQLSAPRLQHSPMFLTELQPLQRERRPLIL